MQVSFTDDAGNEETLTSAATDVVAAEPQTNSPATGAPTISGTAQVGETLTANTSGVFDADGLTNPAFTYQWLADDSEITGATGLTYTLVAADEGKAIKVEVSLTDDTGNSESLTSATTDAVAAAPTPNNPATGAPTISGTAQVGEVLEANTSGIADADGISNVRYEHQWLADDTEIAGATGSTYTLADADEGKAIKVEVSFTDDAGNDETLTSAATDAVAAAPAANSPATGVPTISGTAQVGETLTANTSGVADEDGLDEVSFTYQWLADDSGISGATNATYTLVDADEGKAIKVEVTFTDDAGYDESLTSEATEAVAATPTPGNTPATGAPTISGTAQVGETLTANTSGIADADGISSVQYEYQWLADDADISGATNATYTLVAADEGQVIKVRVSFTDDAGNEESLTSAATDAVAAAPTPNTPATGAPTINGTAQVGQTLTAHISGIADADGLSSVRYEYQWLADGADIAGATGLTYTLTDSEESKAITVQVSFTDDADNEETLTSAATDAVAAQPTPNSPATGAPTITGTVQVGETLTTNTSGIADADGLGNVQYEYQWLADDSEISGATNGTYTLVNTDEGKAIKVQVGFTDDQGNEESLTSGATDAVVARPNSPATGAPTISGTAQVGETLTADTSGVLDAEGLSNVQYEYQWLADDAEIAGTTGLTYTLAAADEGKAITVQVSFTDDAGNDESLTSGATEAVAATPTPDNTPATGAPTISGTARVGETLEVNTSGIADADGLTNVSFTYQWIADDAEIAGAAGSTYTLTDSEESKAISVRVSFTDDAGNEETLTSAPTDAVAAAPTPNSPATGAPTITGTVKVGETLTADTSGIADADGLGNVQYQYRWLADDAEIAGATGLTYTLADTDEGKAIKVEVTFTDDAGNDESMTSAATDAVSAETSEPPDKPKGLDATAAHDSVTLTWDDPGDDSITGYVILRRIPGVDPEGHFDELVANTGTSATTYTDSTVSAETRYTYRIKAISGAGTSERSRWFHIDTPAAPVPDQPTGLEATASHGQVVLNWDAPGNDSITGYVILRRVRVNNTGGDFSVLVADTGSAATTYTDDTVAASTTYTYRIKAINEHGTSERSRWSHIDIPETP